ncbi:hypothetical protein PVAP13_4NG211886 [Panicum virgatum]|uniref:Uncharacterized protein n=1 Tax=Panicum virgatum TaxID=38727 RepID=A0A8T0T8S7_PANVG|nr:hypothetical protein PVAP13_4NG211886 [Panicum virgatum]
MVLWVTLRSRPCLAQRCLLRPALLLPLRLIHLRQLGREGAGDGAPAAVAELSPYHGGTTLEPEPLRTRAPGVAHPRVSGEVPAGLIHDDLLEERVCKKMLNSLKQVNIHHKKMALRSRVK